MTSVIRPTMTLADLADLRETEDVEIKLALGRDGQGELPKDFWPTYSATAVYGASRFSVSDGQFRKNTFGITFWESRSPATAAIG